MGFSIGGGGAQKFPSWTAPFTRFGFTGATPGGGEGPGGLPMQGLMGDAYWGGFAYPSSQFGQGLAAPIGNSLQAGQDIRQLASMGSSQGFGNAQWLANQGLGGYQNLANLAGLVPGAIDAATFYLQGVNPAISGANAPDPRTARVTDAALAQLANTGVQGDIYGRTADILRPEVRSGFSARGMGGSGAAIQGESDTMQNLADQFAQRAMQERIGLLNAAASAAGPEASERVGMANVGVDRGRLGLAASQIPGQVLQQMAGVYGAPMDALSSAMGLQGGPLSLAGLGEQLYQQGLMLPLEYQQALYEFTRDPQKALLAALAGTQQSSSTRSYGGGLKG
jgi:hypothetical protein